MTSIAYWPHFPPTLSFEAARSGSGKFTRRIEGDNFNSPFSKTNWETKGTRTTVLRICSPVVFPSYLPCVKLFFSPFMLQYNLCPLSVSRIPPPPFPLLYFLAVSAVVRAALLAPPCAGPAGSSRLRWGEREGSRQLMLFSHSCTWGGENEDLT